MKAIVAIDSFKGCLSTFEAGEAACRALLECGYGTDDILMLPVSDGGEGFCDVVSHYCLECEFVAMRVHAPHGNIVDAVYVISGDTAYVESASVCSYNQVPPGRRRPSEYSSYGLGELIADAAGRGVSRIVVGLGGTATCDGGAGMLQALGVRFRDGDTLLPEGSPLLMKHITGIDFSCMMHVPCSFEAWVDTSAVFCGEEGAVRVYGPQKGVSPEEIDDADAWMAGLGALYGISGAGRAGYGAAGGLGGALAEVLGAEIVSGADKIIELSRFKDALASGTVDVVITGEGKFDSQTVTGKLPARTAAAAYAASVSGGRPELICVAGKVEPVSGSPFDTVIQISPEGMPLEEAMKKVTAMRNLTDSLVKHLGR